MAPRGPFDPGLLTFFRELEAHNKKPWFEANRTRYERVYKDAFADFVTGFAPRLSKISPHFVADARPSGGSVMRIYRDTRFSKDKSPYRAHTVVHFRHVGAPEGAAPGFYLYVSPSEISAGGGLWHPEPAVAHTIRSAIAEDPDRWLAATATPSFRRKFEMSTNALQRPPAGFSKDHPHLAELKRTDFAASSDVSRAQFLSSAFPSTLALRFEGVAPLVEFLCDAVDLPF